MKREPSTQTAVRLPNSFLKRLDKLVLKLSPPGVHVTRAEVLRRAAFLGVTQLETETKK